MAYRPAAVSNWRAWPHAGIAVAATIAGLNASTVYEVRIRAHNGEVPSNWSPPGSARTNATVDGWLARFARTVAQQMLEGVQQRLAAPRRQGFQGAIAGYGFDDNRRAAPYGAGFSPLLRAGPGEALSPWGAGGEHAARLVTTSDLLMGSAFELTDTTTRGGNIGVWGRGGFARFDGREGAFGLDGDVAAATLGADYAKGPWTAGLALSHSWAVGSYDRAYSQDSLKASLTGLYPYAGVRVADRFSLWGVGGFGDGSLTHTPENGAALETGIGLVMAGAGARGLLVTAANGFELALRTDGFWVRATSQAALGVLGADVVVSRVRAALESSWAIAITSGSRLTPRLDISVRRDGGDAEPGLGVDIAGGLFWSSASRALMVALETRGLIAHEVAEYRDWSVSGSVRYDPNPFSDRGVSASLRSSVTAALMDNADTLPGGYSPAMPNVRDGSPRRQLATEVAYGFAIMGGHFTGTPWAGAGLLEESGRDYRVGYRISGARQARTDLQLGIEGVRRENVRRNAQAEHAVGVRLALRW